MNSFDSVVTFRPETPGYGNVLVTINQITHGKRTRLRLKLADALHHIREVSDEMDRLVEEGDFPTADQPNANSNDDVIVELNAEGAPASVKTDGKAAESSLTLEQRRIIGQISDLETKVQLITASEVDIEYLRIGLVSITGFEINGAPATADSLFEDGPEELCKEILSAIKRQAGITDKVRENLKSPTTSGAPVDGQTSGMIAPDVSDTSGTKIATVQSISQN